MYLPEVPEKDEFIPKGFPNDVLSAVDQLAKKVKSKTLYRERDEIPGINIAPENSRDTDTAFWIEQEGDDCVVHLTIADISSLVDFDSPIDRSALERAMNHSVRSIRPMIPPTLSGNVLSLREGEKRPTLTISVRLGPDLTVKDTKIRPTHLINRKNLSYPDADRILHGDSSRDPLAAMIRTAYQLALRVHTKRRAAGALCLFDPEVRFVTNEEGNIIRIPEAEAFRTQLIVREFDVLANAAVAEWLSDFDERGIYRNHRKRGIAPNNEVILDELEQILATFDASNIREKLRRWFHRATYDSTIVEHTGLQLPAYAHFSSPFSRYADLALQRIVKARLRKTRIPYSNDELDALCKYLTRREEQIRPQYEATQEEREEIYRATGRRATGTRKGGEGVAAALQQLEAVGGGNPETLDLPGGFDQSKNYVGGLQEVCQRHQWDLPLYRLSQAGTQHGPTITVTVHVRAGNYGEKEASAQGPNGKIARQLASFYLLDILVQLGLAEKSMTAPNSKGMLGELCQSNQWLMPMYEVIEQSGPPHAMVFTVRCTLHAGGKKYEANGEGTTKKEAEQIAAQQILEKIRK